MLTKEIVVTNKLGVHARPAGMIVDITGKSQSDISLEYEGNKVNAKSILNVMMLALRRVPPSDLPPMVLMKNRF